MGMFKKIIRQTSNKLLSRLSPLRYSHEFIIDHHQIPIPTAPTIKTSSQLVAPSNRLVPKSLSTSTNGRKSSRRRMKMSKKNDLSAAALYRAAENNLPPVQFHHVHGPNVILSNNKFVARRTHSFCQALVFSNRVIYPNERVYIKVLDIAKGWSGTIRFGFTSVDPATLRCQVPRHVCPDMTNAGHTWAKALADEVVRRNSVIHFSYDSNGYIHFGINNQDCGIFHENINTSQQLWFIVDIYGLTAAVELIDPRIHNATSEIDLSRLDLSGENIDPRRPIFKSTTTMNQVCDSTITRTKKKKSRISSQARRAELFYEPWYPEALLMTSQMNPRFNIQEQNAAHAMLPNLNSMILPSAQQNIYSPMPINNPHTTINEPHGYYQVMPATSTTHPAQSTRIPQSVTDISNVSSSTSSSALNSSAATSGSDVREISCQLENMHVSSTIDNNNKQSVSPTKSTSAVSSTRRRQQNGSNHASGSRMSNSASVGHSLSLAKARSIGSVSTSAPAKSKSRQSIKKPLVSKENNDTGLKTKDCPICFERPINCVLYQCGHICTCYECGVKQWRTQSKTCPICRCVIKDVIKFYMS